MRLNLIDDFKKKNQEIKCPLCKNNTLIPCNIEFYIKINIEKSFKCDRCRFYFNINAKRLKKIKCS